MSRAAASLVVLASGGGRTLDNLAGLIEAGRLPARIDLVILSKPGLGAEERARRRGLACTVIGAATHPDRAARQAALLDRLDALDPDWVVLAGWLQLVPVPPRWEGRIVNIHPALLPAYGGPGCYGHRVHEAVARDGRRLSGCTVHFATEVYDAGPVILQEAVTLPAGADADAIADAVFAAECRAYPDALRALLAGEVRWQDGAARWR